MPNPAWDSEAASAAGKKGAAVRWERYRLQKEDPEAFLRETFEAHKSALSRELLDAALGRGEWHDLPLEKRLAALTKALEYAVGRPVQRSSPKDEGADQNGHGGLELE